MEPNKEEINKKEGNIFQLTLLSNKRLENEKKEKINKLTDVLISYNIFPYLNMKEAKEAGKVNTRLYNAFVRHYNRECDQLLNKYNVKIENNYKPNEIYEQKDDKGHFIKLSFFNLEHYLLFSYFDFTWKNDPRYWNKITPKNSILNKDICHLITVCWVDVNANMSHVFNGKYKLYLHHCVCKLPQDKLKLNIFLDGVPLQQFLYPSKQQVEACRNAHSDKKKEDKKEEGKIEEDKKEDDKKEKEKKEEDKKEENKKEEEKKEENNEFTNIVKLEVERPRLHRIGLMRCGVGRLRDFEPIEYNKDNSLYKEFIMDININYDEKKDKSSGHELKVQFDHADGSWKNDWLIDGVILEKEKI